MKLVEDVFEISEKFMKNPGSVKLNHEGIERTASQMLQTGIKQFPPKEVVDKTLSCLLELIGGSINYCYWYGKSTIRPNECSSSKMYELVTEALNYFEWDNFDECIEKLIHLLSVNRFPLLEERAKHLRELVKLDAVEFATKISNGDHTSCEPYLYELVSDYTGYGSDIFLKRASLFFLQLYRTLGWFSESMFSLHVPADYQVPKLLQHHGCISYSEVLKAMLETNYLIAKHSQMECEIRAATVLACRELVNRTGWNIADIDGWLWLRRKDVTSPFHLTITTDY